MNTPQDRMYRVAIAGRDKALAERNELRSVLEMMLRAFNVESIDPLTAFATIEKARAALAKCKDL